MRIQARSGSIFVDDAGTGDCPVVFLHSLAGNGGQWMPQLMHVRKSNCAIAIDLRGHGRSDLPDNEDYTLEAVAEDVMAVAEALGLDHMTLVGHSMGAGIATVFAGAHPDMVHGLMLVDPVADQRLMPEEMEVFMRNLDSSHYDEFVREYYKSIAGADRDVRDQVLRDLDRTPRAAVVGMLRALSHTNLTEAILSYKGPKAAVVTPHNNFDASLHRIDPTVETTVVNGTGHWLHMERPDEFNAILDRFLDELPPHH